MHLHQSLMAFAENLSSPLLMVVVMAVVFALDPCLMLTNIAAIGYIGGNISDKKRVLFQGLYYTLGRTLTYGIIGCVMIAFLQVGKSVVPIQEFIEHYGNTIMVVFMIVMGVLLCVADYIPWLGFNLAKNVNQEHFKGGVGAFLLGAVLSFAFCPTNAMLFFGMLVPVCTASSMGYALPFVFSFTTAIPVIIIAIVMAFSLNSIARYYGKIQLVGKIVKRVVGIAFILIGIYLIFTGMGHHH